MSVDTRTIAVLHHLCVTQLLIGESLSEIGKWLGEQGATTPQSVIVSALNQIAAYNQVAMPQLESLISETLGEPPVLTKQ
ncbi:hypothetical protein [Pseudomonas putida]